MNRKPVSYSEYAHLVNEKMKEHVEYKEGMLVELTPQSSDKPLGLQYIKK